MTLSRFKAWFGLIICESLSLAYKASKSESYSEYDINLDIKEIVETAQSTLTTIEDAELKYIDIIRIIIFVLIRKAGKDYDSSLKLVLVSELKEKSPYLLAYNFNKSQIMNLNEFSTLF